MRPLATWRMKINASPLLLSAYQVNLENRGVPPMNLHQQRKLKPTIYTVIILMAVWVILPYGMNYFFDSSDSNGFQTAAAKTQYGILGRQAPELNLTTWIDGDGKQMDPVKLKDYRGKVIFLYFFQDW
jgi:hypothetical protein